MARKPVGARSQKKPKERRLAVPVTRQVPKRPVFFEKPKGSQWAVGSHSWKGLRVPLKNPPKPGSGGGGLQNTYCFPGPQTVKRRGPSLY